jgi:hypothetical protein
MTTYKEIQADLLRRAKAITYPKAFDARGFPVASLHSGPSSFVRQPGMVLEYRDGKQYRVMPNGEQRRIK